ncbi:hypothetical protein SAMD00019534_055270 [Acytostelium subglobosum LB1]|uniref:hypothetical protein n=1 Tax=Acytostelium subglobosum LB1 TaxID=1410327 RepID=UPI000644DF23|nr:hypothetical protein SAMD00019534_055270 [Acytostelium subglobosum LB1]GAM22352.1 hypothetical protein SAMD00019534_055270 [Acytostelium subglobosum LB1]|eukprot:XP_012754472.1 hypothetical protein SAMD00019534_055270 [Acytostelium subglobosum LB1]
MMTNINSGSNVIRLLILVLLATTTYTVNAQQTGVPVYVMLPLGTISNENQLVNASTLFDQLSYLQQNSNVTGVMTDVWWGLVEQQAQQYDWSGYQQLFALVEKAKLKIKITMSFHQCGGNVGDECNVPLPPWVLSVGQSNPDIFYTDQNMNRDQEYLSCGIDQEPLFGGRTPVDIYADFMASFLQTFDPIIPGTLTEIQVGLGPAGEMRYPSYQLAYWTFPGVGEFQCYDKYLLAQLAAAANQSGNPLWGLAGPDNAGNYNSFPDETAFFSANGYQNYQSTYGQFFLNWYASTLIEHGDRILARASTVFASSGVVLTAKVSGVHWWYGDPSHAAELTAGYKNDLGQAYLMISNMFAKHGVSFDFTCLEMRDSEQPSDCLCRPEELVGQTKQQAQQAHIRYSGENALQRYDQDAYSEIEYESTRYFLISGFSYLRLDEYLVSSQAFPTFQSFVQTMSTLTASS